MVQVDMYCNYNPRFDVQCHHNLYAMSIFTSYWLKYVSIVYHFPKRYPKFLTLVQTLTSLFTIIICLFYQNN